MATTVKLQNNKIRVVVRNLQTFIKSKTFNSPEQAKQWSDEVECQIETILNLKPKKLKNLSPEKIELLGGMELFQKFRAH